jgi:hypothetical protein
LHKKGKAMPDYHDNETSRKNGDRFMFLIQVGKAIDSYSKRAVQMAIYIAINLRDARNPVFRVVPRYAAQWMGVSRSTAYNALQELVVERGHLVRVRPGHYRFGIQAHAGFENPTQGWTLNIPKTPEEGLSLRDSARRAARTSPKRGTKYTWRPTKANIAFARDEYQYDDAAIDGLVEHFKSAMLAHGNIPMRAWNKVWLNFVVKHAASN